MAENAEGGNEPAVPTGIPQEGRAMSDERAKDLGVSAMDLKLRFYEQLRAAVVHEDNLVNHRLTWLVTIEGFLITGFFVLHSAVLDKLRWYEILGLELLVIIMFGMASWICLICGVMVHAAYRQIGRIRIAWIAKYPGEDRPELERMPAFPVSSRRLRHSAPAPSDYPAEGEAPETGPRYPSIIGEFDLYSMLSTQTVPFIFMLIDGVLMIASLLIGIIETWKGLAASANL
jgi:hypothetical protein